MIQPVIPKSLLSENISAGFTTRHEGVSHPPFDSLNLGSSTPDNPDAVSENLSLFLHYLGTQEQNAVFMRQVHGNDVHLVDYGGDLPVSDGLVTSVRGIALCVRTADCIPLLMYDPKTPSIAAVHCGWRPLVSGITERSIDLMSTAYGTRPSSILAVMGPSAGPCCYEIGDDLAARLHPDSVIRRNDSLYGDLRAELKRRLVCTGIREGNIEIIADCTICNESLYYSHRRDGNRSGRMVGYIMIKESDMKKKKEEITNEKK